MSKVIGSGSRFLAACVFLSNLLVSSPAQAQYIVNTTADGADIRPGDGVCLTADGACSLRAAIQDGNAAPGPNGAVLPPGTYVLTLGSLVVTDNFLIEGDRAVTTVIDGNAADRVIDHVSGGLTLRRVTIRNGRAADGGGVHSASLLIVEESVIRGNAASGSGGGLYLSSPAQIVRSTIAQNRAAAGAGVFLTAAGGAFHTLSDSTVSTNTAAVGGGGIAVATDGGVGAVLTHVTVHNNAAPASSSLLVNTESSVVLRNSIVSGADNCGGDGAVIDEGGNLATTACGSLPVSATLDGTIRPLALYHPPFAPGPMLGHGLTAGSPAIGAALTVFCTPVDERGLARPIGGACDSGAFEYDAANGPYVPSASTLELTPVADQTIRTGTSTNTMQVTARNGAGAVERLELSAGSSDEGLIPSSGIRVTRTGPDVWTFRVLAAPNRTGIAVVTLTAVGFAPDEAAVSRFAVTVNGADGQAGGGTPTATAGPGPSNVVAVPSGSGAILTWSASTAPGVRQYAVALGRPDSGVTAVLVTAGTETTMTLPSLPAGTHVVRVYAIGTYGVSAPSADVAIPSSSTEAPGTPYGVSGAAVGQSVEITGLPPTSGAPPSAYVVEIGTTPGTANVASPMPSAAPFRYPLGNGFYWVQARALSGALRGVPSSTFAVQIGPPAGGCIDEPHAPVLLPPAVTNRTLTLTWLRAPTGSAWRSFRLERLSGPNGLPVETFNLQTQALIYVTDLPPGTYYYRVAAENTCGVGALSNAVTVTVE